MTPDELTAIEERLNAATPGEWRQNALMVVAGPSRGMYGGTVVTHTGSWDVRNAHEAEANAALIAHAPTDLRALIDALRAERVENAKLRAERDELRADFIAFAVQVSEAQDKAFAADQVDALLGIDTGGTLHKIVPIDRTPEVQP